MRFEPGDELSVRLVEIGGTGLVSGGNGLEGKHWMKGDVAAGKLIIERMVEMGFQHAEAVKIERPMTCHELSREAYARYTSSHPHNLRITM